MRTTIIGLCAAAVGLAAAGVRAQSFSVATEPVVAGLVRPLLVTAPPGDTSRIFIVEQRSGSIGRIRIVNLPGYSLNATPFLSVSPVSTGSEQGLLGLAFHPNYLSNGYFYVNYTRTAETGVSAGSTIVARYRANPPFATSTTADPASATILMTIRQPDANHNGGWMSFGPDGNLYIATGDGGCGNDSNCGSPTPSIDPPGHTANTGNAQDVTANLLGKILRIDVDGPDNIPGNADDADTTLGLPYRIPAGNPFSGTNGDREIFIYGLRNPWRNAFDRLTGDLWIADVGQGQREEVNFIAAGTGSGFNMGWRCMEGTRCTGLTGCTCGLSSLRMPILEYPHSGTIAPTTLNGCSITGGYVYRGSAIPCLRGHYFFADYCTPQIWTVRRAANGTLVDVTNRTTELDPPGTAVINNVMSFGEDAMGELYICDQTGGEVFKIIPGTSSGADCNANGVPDFCDLTNGTSQDANGNGIPDECECDPDLNQDGNVDQDDIAYLINVVGGGPNPTGIDPDFNRDGNVDQDDVSALINTVGGGGCP
jgi:glucose/arabinose dehydrogenase